MGLMGSVKPLASLSSGLLARKGQARPAMRPQGFASMTGSPAPLVTSGDDRADARLDDLGWNDMGVVDAAPPVPPVLVEREALARDVAAIVTDIEPPLVVPSAADRDDGRAGLPAVPLATARRIGRESAEQAGRGKAAFTLRLEGERHLRLRLASAVAHRSAQALVVDALDRFLATMPEVDVLIAQLPQAKGGR